MIALSQGKVLLDGQARDVLGQEEILATTYVEPPAINQIGETVGVKGNCQESGRFFKRIETIKCRERWLPSPTLYINQFLLP